MLPVFKELNNILFYPVQYEGEESERNVFYTGAAPNQQAIPAVEYLMSKDGGSAKRFVLLGTDYVYPRTTNKILRAFLKSKGVKDADIDDLEAIQCTICLEEYNENNELQIPRLLPCGHTFCCICVQQRKCDQGSRHV